ncbi:MAG: lantibiotic dehydratase [Myxococcales bacterium]|nr:lantibiotic dehydratase [Myxococcales bacterium]
MSAALPLLDRDRPALARSEPEIDLAGFALGRRGALPLAELEPLLARRTRARLDQIERMRAERQPLGEALRDELYALVPTVPPEHRRPLIDVQRAIHNDRALAPEAEQAACERLSEDGRARLRRWMDGRRREAEELAAAATVAKEELAEGRRALARLAIRDDVARGLQLSGDHIDESIERYVRRGDPSRPPNKNTRHAEATLVSYLCRMALKTSPFGAFTELFVQAPEVGGAVAGLAPGHQRRMVRLSRALLDWAEAQPDRGAGAAVDGGWPCWWT